MAKVFFTSDPHLGHKNLVEGLRNMSVEECDNLIISNWNRVVSKRDMVYVLGDLVMEKHNIIEKYIRQLNGNIIIVGGNHDNRRCCIEYQRLGIPVMGALNYKGYICTHLPVHESALLGFKGNIHGHIHKQGVIDGVGEYYPETIKHPRYYNVNVEFHDYTPIEFSEIERFFSNKNT